jgi:hypothetical protein
LEQQIEIQEAQKKKEAEYLADSETSLSELINDSS